MAEFAKEPTEERERQAVSAAGRVRVTKRATGEAVEVAAFQWRCNDCGWLSLASPYWGGGGG